MAKEEGEREAVVGDEGDEDGCPVADRRERGC